MMTNSRSMSFAIEDLANVVEQLRGTVANLQERVLATEREPRTVTLKDMCAATGLSLDFVKKNIREGKLPGHLVGERYVIPDLEFDAWRRGEWKPRQEHIPSVRNFRHRISDAG